MRKMMWFAMGFALSCGICAYVPEPVRWVALVPCLLCLFFLFGIHGRKEQLFLRAAAVGLGCAAGFLWFLGYSCWYVSPVEALKDREVPLQITASDHSFDTGYGSAADGLVTREGKPYQIRVYLEDTAPLAPGDAVEGVFQVRLTKFGMGNGSSYFQGKGIFLLAYQKGTLHFSRAEEIPKWCFPAVLRQKLLETLEALCPRDTAAFCKALLLGYGRELDYQTNTAFKVSGIRHIIAVSGLHISILYGLICVFTLRRRYLTAAVGMPVLLLFAAVAGFTPSVVRACIMVWLMLLAQIFQREYDALTALAFAVLVMLLTNPLAVASVSLQLSVGCVAGILLFHPPIYRCLQEKLPRQHGLMAKLWGMLCSSISVSLSAMSLVTPLVAYYFGTVSLVSVLTNLLTLWAVNLTFHGLVAVCALYPLLPGVSAWLARILAWPVRYVLWISGTLASFPLAAVYTKSIYIVFWLVFVYVLLAVFLRMQRKRPRLLMCCGVLGLCLALLVSWLEPLTADTGITMLDVGQGQSILLQSEGKTYLVDCGGDDDERTADIVAEVLLSQGISRLDGIILTHYDRDHAGALHHLLTRIDSDLLFLPDTRNDMADPITTGKTVYVWEPVVLHFGSTELTVFGPVYSGYDNENSLCVLFDTEKCDILITGDRSGFGERMLLRAAELPDVDILVAGHHGAADAACEELLQAVAPETVLISVGRDNFYGHPDPVLLERLDRHGCRVYRTDLHGTITIRR